MPDSIMKKKDVFEDAVSEVTNDLKETTKKAVENMKNDGENELKDIQGTKQKGESIVASVSGIEYFVKPCPLSKIPLLVGEVKKIEEILSKPNVSPSDLLSSEGNKAIKAMANIIKMGINACDKDIDELVDEFSLGDFPKIYRITLDINDFLAGMRTIYTT